jgi:sterol desaturase/sphingolipid hydroxylase (fatty acid hydroxylase superfamily)
MDDTTLGTRNAKGEWTPASVVGWAPFFDRPIRWRAVVSWLRGYLFGFNLLYAAVAVAAWHLATPPPGTMTTLSPGWIALVLARNAAVLCAWYGLFHWQLYRRRAQDAAFKYNLKWPAARHERFMFGSQLRENMFWTVASGLPIWTAYEAVSLWLASRGSIPTISWMADGLWFVALMALIPLYREIHFYAVHRLIHVPALYKRVHSLHHRNTSPMPWSGLSMHPSEHVLYFSAVALLWVVPAHPIHMLFTLFHLAMAPVPGHAGFEIARFGPTNIATHGYAHYLHHKLFEVNYSDGTFPLDRWFGSYHDGSPEADERLKARRRLARVS